MKKDTKNLILGVGLAGAGFVAGKALTEKKMKEDEAPQAKGYGYPGVGGMFPAESSIVPKNWLGKPTPLWFDAATWGTLGAAVGYFLLAGKKL